jgi:hypothetical protein
MLQKEKQNRFKLIALLISLILLILPLSSMAAKNDRRPFWSLEVKGGKFFPDQDNWETFYGDDNTSQFAVAFGYKFLRKLEVGAEVGFIRDEGVGLLPLNQTLGGEVKYTLIPLDVFVLFRAVFKENQWVVPYVGGGWTRAYYSQEITNQDDVEGKADGYNARAGIQILLDNMAPKQAHSAQEGIGLDNSYLIFEAKTFSAKKNGIELGGTSYLIGLLFEF